ncbi:riboflavin biosynthesis protein RibF [Limosilactobacillus sp. STM2_1]|uniref:Riboflavin biosynthesis protein n=1 Tax=Limosilactobacillus rudii TaxID=2759755 RepID=A0A7W3YMB1_9LACO|nr:riboflavin biosynthesis protein RibF [Limosilactobacillus rudii]MBB1078634.1 riboflavin biosynthesis protein RibF [Limosilactobacillus rudii]MBB1097274.1 riboflavin biosynthesis protein RibF [Limosilactobacillus rudii]MCD7133810.1 riboflavin biosynthesis protein RibF [Limosilactobacillus rudii]
MQVIKIRHPLRKELVPAGDVVLAMGFFDGVHRGHQAVIARARKIAKEKGLPLAVLTYDHAPGIVYRQYEGGFKYLSTVTRKLELLEKLGVDIVYLISFTSSFANLAPQHFVDQYLIGFHAQIVVAGFDHTYGLAEVASMDLLPKYAAGRFEVVTVPKLTENNGYDKISSHEIRQFIDKGSVKDANQALGYTYQTTGLVVHGLARGRTLGFPTINVEHPTEERIPGIGVYAVRVKIGNNWYGGMASVGHNITFGDSNQLTVEIYLFDFHQMVYGEEVLVRWHDYLRGEEKFAGAKELIEQMKQDEQNARQILNNIKIKEI